MPRSLRGESPGLWGSRWLSCLVLGLPPLVPAQTLWCRAWPGGVLAMSESSRRSQHLPRQPLRAIIPIGHVTPPSLSSWYYFRALAASPAAGKTWVRVALFHSRRLLGTRGVGGDPWGPSGKLTHSLFSSIHTPVYLMEGTNGPSVPLCNVWLLCRCPLLSLPSLADASVEHLFISWLLTSHSLLNDLRSLHPFLLCLL